MFDQFFVKPCVTVMVLLVPNWVIDEKLLSDACTTAAVLPELPRIWSISEVLVSPLWVTKAVGALNANSIIFLFGLGFLTLVALHYSIRLSELTDRNKDLAQSVAILASEIEELRKNRQP